MNKRQAVVAVFTIILISSVLAFLSPVTKAADTAEQPAIGSVIMVQGQVYAKNLANVSRALQRRSDVYLKDTIVTLADSKAQLRLNDSSIIVLQPSSQFSVSDFSFNSKEPKNNRYIGNIVQGALINISGQGKPENYQLKSPLSAITFRGTGLFTRLNSKGNVYVSQDLNVFKGYVTVASICDERRIEREFCVPRQMEVGVGQKMTAATIDAAGHIQPATGASMLNPLKLGKTMTKESGGTVSVQCRINK